MPLKKFKASTRSEFVDISTGEWAQLGDWRPTYYGYEWVGREQYLIVSDEMSVLMFGKLIPLNATEYNGELFEIKDLQNLEKPGTYKRWRKSR